MESIADRIMIVVNANGGNKSEFARAIDVTPAYISKIDKDRTRVPSDRTINDICRKFNVNEDWLRYGTGAMSIEPTQKEKLTRFFADVLATAPDERSAFIAALAELPTEFWPLITELAKGYVANIKKEED